MNRAIALPVIVAAVLQLAACDRQPPILGESPNPTLPAGRVVLRADLSGKEEVPPTASMATGVATAILNPETQELTWSVNYEGLSSPAVAAHLHGPSEPDKTAVGQVNIGKGGLESPLRGSAKVTPEEAQQILDGKWYVSVQTAKNLGGEIRGQLRPLPGATSQRQPRATIL
jgi:hypothetical protein